MAQAILENKITFNMRIQNIQQLTHVFSNTFNIRGLEWKFKITKKFACQEKNRMEDSIGVWVYCNIPNKLKDYMCGAQAKIKLVSFDDNRQSHQDCIARVYDLKKANRGISSFITWKKLFANGYVQNDSVLFEMELRVGPLVHQDSNDLMMKTIEDKYEGEKVTEKLMKLILNKVDDDFVAAKSSEFKFDGLLWHVAMVKSFYKNESVFTFRLYCHNEQSSEIDWLYELSTKLKLIPVNTVSAPIEKLKSFKFDRNNENAGVTLIDWSKLEGQFIKNDSIEMMVELKVKQHH